jgi:PAP2 superfamily
MNTHAHTRRTVILAFLISLFTAFAARANAVATWNGIANESFVATQGTNPMAQSRTYAILHAAIHDALNAIEPRFAPYTRGLPSSPNASPDVAVATAAHAILVTLVPAEAARFDAAYEQVLSAHADGPAKTSGIALGKAAASATLRRRQSDGFDAAATKYVPRTDAGEYRFTPPFDFAALPGLGRVQPFVIDLRKHAVKGPQPLSSADYARDLAYVRAIGASASTTRTAEQSEIARFWYEDSPLGWNRITNTVVRQGELDAWSAARAFALVNFAMADGFIAGFDAKYKHRFWRPETAIHEAANDDNPLTEADAEWKPFLITPPVPDYPSTHTVLGWAAAEVLAQLFGDDVQFTADSLTLPGVTRRYTSFSRAAEENGLSRIYAGIHFRHAVNDGKSQGKSVGREVARALGAVRPANAVARSSK